MENGEGNLDKYDSVSKEYFYEVRIVEDERDLRYLKGRLWSRWI